MMGMRPKFAGYGQLAKTAVRAVSNVVSIPAPVQGWNARDSIAAMQPLDAVQMTNFFPATTTVNLRFGYSQYATGLTGQAETVMAYSGEDSTQLFAIASGNVYDVTSPGYAGNYLALPSASGDYASTPDSAALDITGNIEIILYAAAPDWTPASSQAIVSKWLATGNQRSYQIILFNTGMVGLMVSTLGTAASIISGNSTVAVGASDGEGRWLRFTRDVTSGAVNIYTSTDAPGTARASISWTQLGAQIATSAGGAFSSTAELESGQNNAGLGIGFPGKIYSIYVYNGIGGTLVASMVANDTTVGDTSWISVLTGETWTVQGAASVAGGVDVIGLSNSRWQYTNFANTGGAYLCMVNGLDKYRVYDGTAWHADGDGSPYDITGVNSTDLADIHVFKSRIWFVEKASLKVWYLALDAIGGPATLLDLRGVFQLGGYIEAMATWTLDAGYGVDDYAVWITSNGEVAVYQLTDPTTATGIALIGIWAIGSPVGRRCMIKYRGDNLIICQDGVYPMAAALQSSRLDPRVSITDKIQNAISQAVTSYGNNFGWQLLQFPQQNMIILNVPVSEGADQQQYVMNTITGAWCNFIGWGANCWELYNDQPYFGGNGFVGLAWNGNSDAGQNINGNALQAFNAFRSPGLKKRYSRIRPFLYTNGSPTIYANLNINFDVSDPTTPLVVIPVSYQRWDIGLWDNSLWGSGLVINQNWQGANGVGEWAAPRLKVATLGVEVQWAATDIVYERSPTPTA